MIDTIKHHMAKAFFACAWADAVEDNPPWPMGAEIMEYMPEAIDPAAIHAADTLAHGMSAKNGGLRIDQIFKAAGLLGSEGADRDLTPDLFGHYCAMQAMGTGVGLESFGYAVRDRVKVPYVEFGQHSLEKDYA